MPGLSLLKFISPRGWIAIGIVAAFLLLWAAYSYQKNRADDAVADARTGRVTTEALDTVATKTGEIRQDEKEKQDEVRQIPGADQRLPDGFGADLERVRRGQRDQDSR